MTSPNVLLIILDSVRYQNTSFGDSSKNTTPFLKEFAEENTLYTQARSPVNTSLPSHTSIFTGHHVTEHNVYDSMMHDVEQGHTIWDDLSSEGYDTAVFSHNPNITGDASLSSSFDDVYRGSAPFESGEDTRMFADFQRQSNTDSTIKNLFAFLKQSNHTIPTLGNTIIAQLSNMYNIAMVEQLRNKPADLYANLFLDWSKQQTEPWAACINMMDAHHAYVPKPENNKWANEELLKKELQLEPHPWRVHGGEISIKDWASFEPLYNGTVYQMDRAIENIINELEQRGELNNTFIAITADHGEGFGEPSRVRDGLNTIGHVAGIHECLLHVPLITKLPHQQESKTVNQMSSLTNFPRVTKSVVDTNQDVKDFASASSVIASTTNIGNKLKNPDRAKKYCEDTKRFEGTARAVYEQSGDDILKHITWGDDEVSISIGEDDVEIVENVDTKRVVENEFSKYNNSNILVEDQSLDSQTMSRLQDLGYV